jgi:N-acetyl-beta-hexosaminidase
MPPHPSLVGLAGPALAAALLLILSTPRLEAGAARTRPDRLAACPAFIPWPRTIKLGKGKMTLTARSRIVSRDAALLPLARILASEVHLLTGRTLPVESAEPGETDIALALVGALEKEAYRLAIDRHAAVAGGDYNGVALGTATLLQALRTDAGQVALPRLTVEDRPHFEYCGTMLDVARQPHSLEILRQCVNVCRFYKIRYMHLHLSDENGWVFPSTAFPRLGSGNFALPGGKKPAVYRLAGLRKLVAYADAGGVTLVPEIEMPGHSGQLRGTLPEIFGYRDKAGKLGTLGVINMVSDRAYDALHTIVGEVCDVFRSSPYLHIGCDEAVPAGIENMPEVKAFVARHKLSSAGAVFNAFVNRMHGIVKKHGKQMIVWEGAPLEPVAPARDLIVMPWVGGAGTAARLVRSGYAIINPPWGTPEAYFDPYLVNGARLKRDEALLLGATSLQWEGAEEATVPFLRYTGALRNEPTYNPDARRGHADFLTRLQATDARLDRLLHGLTFRAKGTLDPLVYMRPEPLFSKGVTLSLETALKSGQCHYTLDGNEPGKRSPAYSSPIKVHQTTTVRARWFDESGTAPLAEFTRTYRQVPRIAHDAIGARVTFMPDRPGYPGPGAKGLTDGFLAEGDEAGSAGWVGWERSAPTIRIQLDLGQPRRIKSLGAHFLRAGGGVALPACVELAVSDDGQAFRTVATIKEKHGTVQRGWYVAEVEGVTARHVRVSPRPGGDWTFVDEVVVNPRLPGPTVRHAALRRPVTLAAPPSSSYSAPGVQGLTDGFLSRSADCMNPAWLGIEGKDLNATIDLGKIIAVAKVGAHFLQQVRGGIRIPQVVDIWVSEDGQAFHKVATVTHQQDDRPAFTKAVSATFEPARARFVRLVAHTNGQWLFADEVFVNPEAGTRLE